MSLRPVRARLVAGRPWSVEVPFDAGRSVPLWLPGERGERVLRPARDGGPPLPAPEPAEVDCELGRNGYVRTEPFPSERLVDGAEFEVLYWRTGDPDPEAAAAEQAATDLALARGTTAVVVTLPAVEVAELRAAVDAVAADPLQAPWPASQVRWLAQRLDAATVDVLLPSAMYTVSLGRLREVVGRRAEAEAPLGRLFQYAEQGRLTTGPWPTVRDALQDAMSRALTLPGAEGLAARDELLGLVDRFAAAHRTATRADDAEQRRLQAEAPRQDSP